MKKANISLALIAVQALTASALAEAKEPETAKEGGGQEKELKPTVVINSNRFKVEVDGVEAKKIDQLFERKTVKEAIQNNFEVLTKNYGDGVKSVYDNYFKDIEKDLIRVNQYSAQGNQANGDSTGAGDTSRQYGSAGGSDFVASCQNPNTQEDGCICHGQCHSVGASTNFNFF